MPAIKEPKFDCYEVLGIEKGATDSEISKAYRKLALQLHPDKQVGKSEEEIEAVNKRFHDVTIARTYLLEKNARMRKLEEKEKEEGKIPKEKVENQKQQQAPPPPPPPQSQNDEAAKAKQKAEQDRKEQERKEQERKEQERKERERREREQREREQREREQREQQQRREQEQRESERKEQTQRERLRKEQERKEQERKEKERKEEQERKEQQRAEQERRETLRQNQMRSERIEKEKKEQESAKKAKKKQEEIEELQKNRLKKSAKEQREKEVAKQKEEEEAKRKAEEERIEQEFLEQKQKEKELRKSQKKEKKRLEKERLEQERLEKERQEEEQRLEQERLEQEQEKERKKQLKQEKKLKKQQEKEAKKKQQKDDDSDESGYIEVRVHTTGSDYDQDNKKKESAATSSSNGGGSCCGSFMSWIFSLYDTVNGHDRDFDVNHSFGNSSVVSMVCKILIFLWVIAVFVWSIIRYSADKYYWFMYLSNWALTASFLYSILSVINTFVPLSQPKDYYPPTSWIIYAWIILTWLLFEIAAHLGIMVTVLYWSLDFPSKFSNGETASYSPEQWFLNAMTHGGICILLWIDGFYINRIPVRWLHFPFVVFVDILYIIWTIVHSGIAIGNPADPNSELLYNSFDWSNDLVRTLVTSAILICVVAPVLYLIMWFVSLFVFPICCLGRSRRYVPDNFVP